MIMMTAIMSKAMFTTLLVTMMSMPAVMTTVMNNKLAYLGGLCLFRLHVTLP